MGETIYVAVNEDVRESKSTLLWTLKDRQFKKLVLLHIHASFSLTTSSCGLEQGVIDAVKESQVKNVYSSLRKYRIICTDKGVNEEDVDTLCISGYDVGEEIVKLIYQNNIKKLVMGAAADLHYSRKMSIKSRKAKYVSEHAPRGCELWFICKGKLITTKQGSVKLGDPPASAQKPSEGSESDANISEEYPIEAQTGPTNLIKGPENSTSSGSKARSSSRPPHEFCCPFTKEIFQNPHIDADGYTYEAEAFREYINKGYENSLHTNLPLQNYNLIPNRTFHSLIKDWQKENPNYED